MFSILLLPRLLPARLCQRVRRIDPGAVQGAEDRAERGAGLALLRRHPGPQRRRTALPLPLRQEPGTLRARSTGTWPLPAPPASPGSRPPSTNWKRTKRSANRSSTPLTPRWPLTSRSSICWRSSPRTTASSDWQNAVQKPLNGLESRLLLRLPPDPARPMSRSWTAPKHRPSWSGSSPPPARNRSTGVTASNAAAPTSPFPVPASSSTSPARSSPRPNAPAPTASWSPAPCATPTSTSARKRSKRPAAKDYNMPVLYMTQLLALAAGVSTNKLGFDSMMVSPLPLLKEKTITVRQLRTLRL